MLNATHLTVCLSYYNGFIDTKIRTEGTAGKQKCVTFNPQKLEIIKRHESGKNERDYGFIQLWIVNCLWHEETKGPVMIICGIKWKCEGPLQARKIERALISASGQGFNSIAFWSKTHNWACWWLKALSAFLMKQKWLTNEFFSVGWLQKFKELRSL